MRLPLLALFALGCWDLDYRHTHGHGSTGTSVFVLDWTLREGETGPVATCAAGDVVIVSSTEIVSSTDLDRGDTYVDRFDCAERRGSTQYLPGSSEYALTITLAAAGGTVRSGASVRQYLPSFSTLDLGTVTFVVAPPGPGSLVVQPLFQRGSAAETCGAATAPGPVHRLEWALERGTGALVASSRPIGEGACASLPGEACLDQLDFGAQPAGTYRLVIHGLDTQCRTCWPRQTFLLQHDGSTTPHVVTLVGSPGC